jgi:Tfp pilus assembly protein PilX
MNKNTKNKNGLTQSVENQQAGFIPLVVLLLLILLGVIVGVYVRVHKAQG